MRPAHLSSRPDVPPETPTISLLWDPTRPPGPACVYRLAGGVLITDAALALPLLAGNAAFAADPSRNLAEARADGNGPLVYAGEGCFAGKIRRIRCERRDAGYFISAEDRSGFVISADGQEISRVMGPDSELDRELLMGPVITLSLALQGVFMLHASAVRIQDKALAFAGRSGAGKSTLAGYLEDAVPGAERLTDDMTPVVLVAGTPHLVTDFPQPKLVDTRPAADRDARPVRLDVLVWLEPDNLSDSTQLIPLGPADILQRLVHSTVGARLFGRELLAQHLAFCSRCAERVDGYCSNLPLEHGSLAVMREFIAG